MKFAKMKNWFYKETDFFVTLYIFSLSLAKAVF